MSTHLTISDHSSDHQQAKEDCTEGFSQSHPAGTLMCNTLSNTLLSIIMVIHVCDGMQDFLFKITTKLVVYVIVSCLSFSRAESQKTHCRLWLLCHAVQSCMCEILHPGTDCLGLFYYCSHFIILLMLFFVCSGILHIQRSNH